MIEVPREFYVVPQHDLLHHQLCNADYSFSSPYYVEGLMRILVTYTLKVKNAVSARERLLTKKSFFDPDFCGY